VYLSFVPSIKGNVLNKHQAHSIVSLFIYSLSNFFPTTQIGILQNEDVNYEDIQFNYIQIHYKVLLSCYSLNSLTAMDIYSPHFFRASFEIHKLANFCTLTKLDS
jgi:hypothetical protein